MNLYCQIYRGKKIESLHRAHGVIVDYKGNEIFSFGNPALVTCIRSTFKPFQAYPTIELQGDKQFNLNDVIILNIDNDDYKKKKNLKLDLNFNKKNLLDSISNYKFIPFYKYKEHLNSLKKFNLYSPEISLYYISTIINPFFLVIIGFIVMGFSGKFKKNENFFKVLFISILIGFLLFLLKEIITALTIKYSIHFLLSYLIIFSIPLIIGLYQIINIEIS